MKVVVDDLEVQVRILIIGRKKGLQGEYMDVYGKSAKIKQKRF